MNTEAIARRYDEILELTRQQCEAIEEGDLQRLLALLARREPLLASLAVIQDGAEDQERRRQIAELDSAHEAALLAWRERVEGELASLQRGRTGLGGYLAHAPVHDFALDRIS